jgi:hypothetical protein
MALQTKRQLVQEILYETYGGITSSEPRLSERFVLTKVNNKIASLAMVSAFGLTNTEGITYADDIFYISFDNIEVTDDTATGFKSFVLPAQPIGLPRQRAFTIYPPSNGSCSGMSSTLFKMMPRHEVSRMMSLPALNKVMCFVQNGTIQMIVPKSMPLLELNEVNLVIASADGGMDSELNLPQDMIDTLKKSAIQECRAVVLGVPMDIKNDGVEILEPKA